MAVSLSTETLNWHCPPWGGTVVGPRYDRKAVKPGIVHVGMTDFHRGHQAHFIDEILGSDEAGCLNWGISAVSLAPDAKMRHAMRKQDGMYTLTVRNGQECHTKIIGAYCEHFFAPDDHRKILHRLCAPSTKILSIMVTGEELHLDENDELDESSEEVQADLQALECQRLEQLSERPFRTLAGYLTATAMIRRMDHEVPLAVLADGPVAAAVMAMASKTFGPDLSEYIQAKWRFPKMVCERVVYQVTPDILEETQKISGVADRCPVVCEDFVRWVVEDKFPSGRPPLDAILNGCCLFVEDAAPFREMQTKVFYGAGQAICYLGLLRGLGRVKDAMADEIVTDFLKKYLAVVLEHAIMVPDGFDMDGYKEEVFERLRSSDQDLDLALNGTHQIEKCCMSCLPAFPKMDTASVKPLVLLLCFWLRYIAVAADENDVPFAHSPDDRLEEIAPLAQILWRNAVKTSKGEGGETLRRPPPREDAKAFISHAFPRVDLGPTVLVEVMASQIVALRANDIATFITTVARL